MKISILLLTAIMLLSNNSQADKSLEASEILNAARQSYKDGQYDNAISLSEKAVALGSPKAMLHLSSMYKYGKAIKKDEKKSNEYLIRAKKIYEKRATNSDADAQFNLGKIYSYKIKPNNKLEGYKWYLMAANNNHMNAQFAVASILDIGSLEPEVKRNPNDAIKWYEKSANQGFKPAIKALTKLEAQQTVLDHTKRVNLLWSTKEKCFDEEAFMISIETDGNAYKVAACAKYGCRIAINEFGKNVHKGDYKDDPKFVWHSDKEFETKINGNNMRFYHCLTK